MAGATWRLIRLDKQKSLEMALMQIERQFGRGSIMKLGAEADRMAVDIVPTGSLSLDIALGVGGVPRGRVIEIFGPESSGKTTVALHILAEAQKQGEERQNQKVFVVNCRQQAFGQKKKHGE